MGNSARLLRVAVPPQSALVTVFFLIAALAAVAQVSAPKFVLIPLVLPGGNGLITLDYFAYD
jgi:hypothetical protein